MFSGKFSKTALFCIVHVLSHANGFPRGYGNMDFGGHYPGLYSQSMMPHGMYPSFGSHGQNSPLMGNHDGNFMGDPSSFGNMPGQEQVMGHQFGYGGMGQFPGQHGMPNAMGNPMMGMNVPPGGGYQGFQGGGHFPSEGFPYAGGYGGGGGSSMGSHASAGPFGGGMGSFSGSTPYGGGGPGYGGGGPFGGGPSTFGGGYGGGRPNAFRGEFFGDGGMQGYPGASPGVLGRSNQTAHGKEKQITHAEEQSKRMEPVPTAKPDLSGNVDFYSVEPSNNSVNITKEGASGQEKQFRIATYERSSDVSKPKLLHSARENVPSRRDMDVNNKYSTRFVHVRSL
uniref:Uncharacterized protein n=1 Tax=Trichuris muris TaxID=70415 RepID=A0A5S6QIY2_TRIMR